MATHMQMAKLDLVDGPGENTQLAAVLEEPYTGIRQNTGTGSG